MIVLSRLSNYPPSLSLQWWASNNAFNFKLMYTLIKTGPLCSYYQVSNHTSLKVLTPGHRIFEDNSTIDPPHADKGKARLKITGMYIRYTGVLECSRIIS